jgi:hypothetical protein
MSKMDKNKSSGKKKANIKLSDELKTRNTTLRILMRNIGTAKINKENKDINQKPKS